MRLKQTNTGVFIDKKEVIAVELYNTKGSYVKIFNYGTIINKFVVKNKKGEEQDIVLGFDDFQGYVNEDYLKNYPYFGAIIGRYANRIKAGRFSIDDNDYQLAQNNGEDCLHGGKEGFDRKIWDIVDFQDQPQPKVTFQYISANGEENFPGNLKINLSFELTEHDELILTYFAETDAPTALNLTHHSYFNLSPTGGSIAKHLHQMNASHVLAQDDNYVVTGELLPVHHTPHDFRIEKEFGQDWNAEDGYDQTYVLDKTYADLTLASTTRVEDGLTLKVYSTEPVAHLYTAKYLDVKNGKKGQNYGPFEAFCVETQHHPNAINIPNFPSTVLRPGVLYSQITIYKVVG